MKLNKILILIFFISFNFLSAQVESYHEAKGVFFSLGVGPRFPMGEFSRRSNIGPGISAVVSYTDVNFLPVFFYGKFGYQNHSGNYKFYQNSDHSTLTSSLFSADFGAKYFFNPIVDDMFLLMPFAEGGFSYSYLTEFYQFKINSEKPDQLENLSKVGFHIGGGLSFFLMDIIASYNYLYEYQFFSLDLRITIPVAASL
ncbi:MAG: hypothetical protein IPH62_10890 [Ignavibacteriae bacterium]|nr:hypothetical protein [Ignavibacteriota bacterium]